MRRVGARGCREGGSITPLVIGLAVIIAVLVAVVVDASAAYLRRQQLDSVADAAALAATDGLAGRSVYTEGLGARAVIDPDVARRAVAAYVVRSGAAGRYPGLDVAVETTEDRVLVRLRAPMRLPLHVAGLGEQTVVAASAASVVAVAR